jgi:hypothetical protein
MFFPQIKSPVSRSHKTVDELIVLYILNFTFFGCKYDEADTKLDDISSVNSKLFQRTHMLGA